jgi:RimJ/RimL family protein N-acetyltransferase
MAWRNSPHVHDQMFSEEKITRDGQESWYRTYLLDATQTRFVIEAGEFGPVGCCGLTDIDEQAGTASLTVYLGEPRARRRGIAGRALRALLDWALGPRGLKRVTAEVFADNAAAVGLYTRLGFAPAGEGRPRRGRAVAVMTVNSAGGAGQ